MAEDKALAATTDPLIRLDEQWEIRNWSHWLHCSEQELRWAVESVGPDPDNVRRFLRQAR